MDARLRSSQAMHDSIQASNFDDWMRVRHSQEASRQVEVKRSPAQSFPKVGHAVVFAEPTTRPAKRARICHLQGGVVGSLHQCSMLEVGIAQGGTLPAPAVRLEEIALEAFDGAPTRNATMRKGERVRPSFAAMAKLGADIRSKHEPRHALERPQAAEDAKTPVLRQLRELDGADAIEVDEEPMGQEHVQSDMNNITLDAPISDEHNIGRECFVGALSAPDVNCPLEQQHASSEQLPKLGDHSEESESKATISSLCTPPNSSASSHTVIKSHKGTPSKQYVEVSGESLTALGAKEVVAARIAAIENDLELLVAKKRKAIALMRMLQMQL